MKLLTQIANNKLEIVFQDEHLVVVNKPSGLLSVPGRGPDKQDCVVNRLKFIFKDLISQPAVHRLDMGTSGLMVLARTKKSHKALSKAFQERQVEKQYIALVDGIIQHNNGEIRLPFRLDLSNRPMQIYDPIHGKIGITYWYKIAEEHPYTRISFSPLTGRTHQLRVHAAHPLGLNFPIVDDPLYGNCRPGESLKLHATFLRFMHPQYKIPVELKAPVPF